MSVYYQLLVVYLGALKAVSFNNNILHNNRTKAVCMCIQKQWSQLVSTVSVT